MTQEKLIDAITDLDSDILNRYFDMKADLAAKKKPKKRTWVKWASMAACFCLIITASVMIIPSFLNNQIENADKITLPGVSVDSSVGNLTLTNNNLAESKCTFTLVKENDKAIYFCFRGFSVLNT